MGSISLAKGLPTRVVLIGSCKRASEQGGAWVLQKGFVERCFGNEKKCLGPTGLVVAATTGVASASLARTQLLPKKKLIAATSH